MDLTNGERNYLLWLQAGTPGYPRKLPQRLVELKLVEVIAGNPRLTLAGAKFAESHRESGGQGGMNA